MRGMILAAGRGARMGKLTAETPKPLLRVGNHFLIEYALKALIRAGIAEIVINISYHGEQIKTALGNGSRYGVAICYSEEDTALETGGGILQALPMLGAEPFVAISGDIVTEFPIINLQLGANELAHLMLVPNPPFLPGGDFCLVDGKVCLGEGQRFTFGSVGLYHPELFTGCKPGIFGLAGLLKTKMPDKLVSGEVYTGFWQNIGNAKQLAAAIGFD